MKATLIYTCLSLLLMATGCQKNVSTLPQPDNVAVEPAESVDVTDELVESAPDTTDDDLGDEVPAPQPHGMGPGMGRGGRGMGRGPGGPGGPGRGMGAMGGMREDMTAIHAMFAARDKVNRTVKSLPQGAEAITESDDVAIVNLLQEHVPAMEGRVMENRPLPPMTFHPIFVELIKHADDYSLEYEETDKGMRVTYHAEDPFVVMLVQEHAKLVSRFLENGMAEIHQPYTLPEMVGQSEVARPATETASE